VPGEPVPFREAVLQTFRPIEIGTPWGRPWSTLWIHVIGSIPVNWAAVDGTVPGVVVDLGFTSAAGFEAEGLAYRPDGTTIKAVAPFDNHVPAEPGEPIDIYLEAAANPDVASPDSIPHRTVILPRWRAPSCT
jgi:alpha-mannosidase